MSNASLSINKKEMKSESGFSSVVASQPFCHQTGQNGSFGSLSLFYWNKKFDKTQLTSWFSWGLSPMMAIMQRQPLIRLWYLLSLLHFGSCLDFPIFIIKVPIFSAYLWYFAASFSLIFFSQIVGTCFPFLKFLIWI